MSKLEFYQKTSTGKTQFKFLKDYFEYSFQKNGMEATEEIYYSELKRGLSKYRERTQSWISVLIVTFVLYGFAAIIIKDTSPNLFIVFNIFSFICAPLLVFYSYKTSVEDFWSISTYHGKRILILDTPDRPLIYDLLKEKINTNQMVNSQEIDFNDSDKEQTVQ